MFYPPTLTDRLSQNIIGNFQAYVNRVELDTKDVCLFCGLFIPFQTSQFVHQGDSIFILGLNSYAFTILSLDQYRHVCNNFLFCKSYFRYIKKLKSLKFSTINIINICICQDYPDVLKEFMLVKKAIIARAYLIISIFKLRPNNTSLLASYHQICGYAVILSQKPGLLLNLLSFNALLLHKIIRMVWASQRLHIIVDILFFGRVKKEKGLNTLLYLKKNILLYENLIINYQKFES